MVVLHINNFTNIKGEVILPVLLTTPSPMKSVAGTYRIDIALRTHDETDNTTLSLDLNITTIVGVPHAFKLQLPPKLKYWQLGTPETLHVHVVDAHGKKLHLKRDAQAYYPQLAHVQLELDVFSETNKCKIRHAPITMDEKQGIFVIEKVMIEGTITVPALKIIARQKQQASSMQLDQYHIKDDTMQVSCIAGEPHALRIFDQTNHHMSLCNYDVMPELEVTAHDKYGNRVSLGEFGLELTVVNQTCELLPRNGSQQLDLTEDDKNKCYRVNDMIVIGVQGEHVLEISVNEDCPFHVQMAKLHLRIGNCPIVK